MIMIAMRHTLPFVLLALLLGFILSGCARIQPPQAFAMATPFQPAEPVSARIYRPLVPTATAVAFQMRPTSTLFPTRTPLPTLEVQFYGPDHFPSQVNPLTGQAPADPGLLERRPMAIKITNFPRSVRPQWGLALADHVWEYYIGDAMTRFVAIFYGNDASRVGPIRSARYFDEHIVRMYKSIFVFGSADERVLNPWLESDLRNFLVIERPTNCPPLCRIGSKNNYNNLFVDIQKLSQYIRGRGTHNERQSLDGLFFHRMLAYSDQPGKRLSVHYSPVSFNAWEYDPGIGRYLRFQESGGENQGMPAYERLTDSLTGEQVSADNLVVLLIPHEYVVNTKTTEMIMMNFLGQGSAVAFRNGVSYRLNWRRDAPEALLSLTFANGQPYPLKPGTTWFQVIGDSSPVEQFEDGSWAFGFSIP